MEDTVWNLSQTLATFSLFSFVFPNFHDHFHGSLTPDDVPDRNQPAKIQQIHQVQKLSPLLLLPTHVQHAELYTNTREKMTIIHQLGSFSLFIRFQNSQQARFLSQLTWHTASPQRHHSPFSPAPLLWRLFSERKGELMVHLLCHLGESVWAESVQTSTAEVYSPAVMDWSALLPHRRA